MVRWFDGALTYPVVPESEILELRKLGEEFNDVSIFEGIRKTQGERL